MSDLFSFSKEKNKDDSVSELTESIVSKLSEMGIDDRVVQLNEIKLALSEVSPFKSEPVDCVIWVPCDGVSANDYNPNSVAPPEMELLRHSINHDGYTQPVVTWMADSGREVIDGFHRTRVCKELDDVRSRVHGYLPVVTVKEDCTDKTDRIASTIRHNRARGKHNVDSMSDIVIELKKRNWTDKRVAKELGMDQDEILRLCQVSGLAELFIDQDFSNSWDVGIFDEGDGIILDAEDIDVENNKTGRIYHTWDRWECHKSGFYESKAPEGMTKEEAEDHYRILLSDDEKFGEVLGKVIIEWKNSCEHYLSNENMNRIAWLGQAALAYELGIPACYRGGYNLLTEEQQSKADSIALEYLNKWLTANGRELLTDIDVKSKTKANLY